MSRNPYEAAGFHDSAIAAGRHRAIVGGRWEETGRLQMQALTDHGLRNGPGGGPGDGPEGGHHLLDIGAGALRLGCKAVPWLEPGHYWATDASLALMRTGRALELAEPGRLPESHLVEDADFAFPGIPDSITHAIAFAVFPHLPPDALPRALAALGRFPRLEAVLFTVFLAPPGVASFRQKDGVVTHADRAPWHRSAADVQAAAAGWRLTRDDRMLPRGQVLFVARQPALADADAAADGDRDAVNR